MRHWVLAALLIWLLALVGCSGVSKQYAEADAATYDAVAPEYLGYVDADPALSGEQRQRRHETVASWKARTDRARTPEEPQ